MEPGNPGFTQSNINFFDIQSFSLMKKSFPCALSLLARHPPSRVCPSRFGWDTSLATAAAP